MKATAAALLVVACLSMTAQAAEPATLTLACKGTVTNIMAAKYLAASQIGGECRQSINLIFCPAIFERNISTFGIAGLVQTLPERGQPDNFIGILRPAAEPPDHRHHQLLCARRERPRDRRATEQRDEIASSYVPLAAHSHCFTKPGGRGGLRFPLTRPTALRRTPA